MFKKTAIRLEALASRLETIASRLEAIASSSRCGRFVWLATLGGP